MDTLIAPDLAHLSRREFLKLSGAGLLSLFWLPFLDKVQRYTRLNEPAAAHTLPGTCPQGRYGASEGLGPVIRMGRCVDDNVEVYDRPTYSGKLRRAYWRDEALCPLHGLPGRRDHLAAGHGQQLGVVL